MSVLSTDSTLGLAVGAIAVLSPVRSGFLLRYIDR